MVNDLYEEQGRQLQDARERQIQSENYASELRGRVAKLNERNHSSEVSRIACRILFS
jgi:kinesin family protein 4/21/27